MGSILPIRDHPAFEPVTEPTPMPTKLAVRQCNACSNVAFGTYASYCTLFNEEIGDEVAMAEDCEEYDGPEEEEEQTSPLRKVSVRDQLINPPDELIQKCDQYLASNKCSTWGRAYSMSDKSRPQAARWLAEQMIRVELTAEELANG